MQSVFTASLPSLRATPLLNASWMHLRRQVIIEIVSTAGAASGVGGVLSPAAAGGIPKSVLRAQLLWNLWSWNWTVADLLR
jgi:hypothetical protein